MGETNNRLWEIFNEFRGFRQSINIFDIIIEASERGMNLTYSDISIIFSSRFNRFGEVYVPEIVSSYVIECLTNKANPSIYEPCARIGEFIDSVAKGTNSKKAIGIIQNSKDYKIANILYSHPNTEFINLETENGLKKNSKFDVVICCPPFNNLAEQIILQSLKYLSDDGIAFFVLPPRFFISISPNRNTGHKMNQAGFYMDSAIYLPSGTWGNTTIPSYLITVC